jgi:chemotaxis protein MotA
MTALDIDVSASDDISTERRRDEATWYGLGAATLLILLAVLLGGSAAAYLDLPAFLLVICGTAAVTTISFPLDDIRRLPRIVRTALFHMIPAPHTHALQLVALAEQAKRRGLLSLEASLTALADDPFLSKAVALVVDNTSAEEVEALLRSELQAALLRHRAAADILRRGGEVAPAMGLIGTLLGLVQMLVHLSNPSAIGPAMAVAILATLYGAILANVVLLPLAGKLDRNGQAEALIGNLTILAAGSIVGQEHPRRLEVILNGILPPDARLNLFD